MAALIILEGNTLGDRHKHFNSKVNEILQQDNNIEKVLSEPCDTDIDYLFQIDIASHCRNVDFIIEVLKSEDMLYVSRAIKKSPWLVTEQQYAHIVNPQHLHTQLFPHMTTKAVNKLLLHIRLHLKDEKRGDEFFNYFEAIDYTIALKWLPNCSLAIIDKVLTKYYIGDNMSKKLFEKKPEFFELFLKKADIRYFYKEYFENSMSYLNTQPNEYLDLIEKAYGWCWPKFNRRHTTILMKKCPERIINKFGKYHSVIDTETVAKHMDPNKILQFLFSISKDVQLRSWFTQNNIKHFVKYLPKDDKFELIKKVFIDQTCVDIKTVGDSIDIENFFKVLKSGKIYQWYEFAEFDIAFSELKKIISTESSPEERVSILNVMLKTAVPDEENILKVLQYYHKKHINEALLFKVNFINSILSVSYTHKYDDASWKILNELFQSCEVYMASDDNHNVQNIIGNIMLYKILNNQPIPDIIKNKFELSSLKSIIKKLNLYEKEKVFLYVCNYLENSLNYQSSIDKDAYEYKTNTYIENIINVLSDWNKPISDFPNILNQIKNFIDIKSEEGDYIYKLIYNKNKSWRKAFFERSLLLSRSEQDYINVLKHNPALLQKYPKEVDAVRRDDNIVLDTFLSKLKIYWNNSIAKEWANAYQTLIKQGENSTSITKGLCVILPRKEILELFEKYAPVEDKIDWDNIDKQIFTLRKNFSKLMYNVRPQPPPNYILPYAHGDYLQYALPSVNSIFYNISSEIFSKYLPQLLNGPVSLQKTALRQAYNKLKSNEIREVFLNVWKSTDNISIRVIIFQKTCDLLRREKSKTEIPELWSLLEMFIDNLTDEENPNLYKLLGDSDKLPLEVQGKFCVKSYKFLKSLPAKARCHKIAESLTRNMSNIIDSIDSDFMDDLLLNFVSNESFIKDIIPNLNTTFNDYKDLLINYLLFVSNEAEQKNRYEKVIKLWLQQVFALWNERYDGENKVAIYFVRWLSRLCITALDNMLEKKYVIPTYVFEEIEKEIDLHLSFESNYNYLTTCKLMAACTRCYEPIKSQVLDAEIKEESGEQINFRYQDMWAKMVPSYSVEVTKILYEDIERIGPYIWMSFSSCLSEIYYTPTYQNHGFSLEAELIKDESCELLCLLALDLLPQSLNSTEKKKELNEIKSKILSNPSLEVRMHFYTKYMNHPILSLQAIENYVVL